MFSTLLYLLIMFRPCFNFALKDTPNDLAGNLTEHRQAAIVNGVLSVPRPFFVKIHVTVGTMGYFCGGAVIDRSWVLTAARCLKDAEAENVIVEARTSTNNEQISAVWVAKVAAIRLSKINNLLPGPIDLAMLKLQNQFGASVVIPLCQDLAPIGTLLGSCGLGSLTPAPYTFTPLLNEFVGYETFFLSVSPFVLIQCPDNSVCIEPVSGSASICRGDEGSPLYTMRCGSNVPDCLYGIAQYSKNVELPGHPICRGGSVFSRVTSFLNRIEQVKSTQ